MSRLAPLSCALCLILAACGTAAPSDSDLDDGQRGALEDSDETGDGDTSSMGGSLTGVGGNPGSGGLGSDSGGTGGGDVGPVAGLFQHCDYDGWDISLTLGDYTSADLVALGAMDNDASSVQVDEGYEVVLFEGDNFTGNSVTITADTPCTVSSNFNDLTSSVRVQVASGGGGTGGSDGTGGGDGDGGAGPTSCQPAFETACKPTINFNNQHANGGGALFNELFPDVSAEMKDIACTVCSILYRSPDEIPQNRRHTTINVTIDAHDGVAYATGNSITMSANHLQNYTNPTSAMVEYRGILVHETVHLYQNYGNGGTGEGIADTVRLRVGLYPPGRCNPGGSWRDAYTTSGCFYSWLTGPSVYREESHPAFDPNLPYKINAALAGQSGEGAYTTVANLLETTFGQNVDTLWSAYQADF